MLGVDDHIGVATRVLTLLRPRLGPSAQSQVADADRANTGEERAGDRTATAEQAGQLAGGLLSQLMAENRRSARERGAGGADAGGPGGSAPGGGDSAGDRRPSSASATAEEFPFAPVTGASMRVPLVAGLTIVGAQHEPPRGDYAPMLTFTSTNDAVSLVFSATLPEGHRIVVNRDVRREDLLKAREYRPWYQPGVELVRQ
jgi:hypothetical protein